MTPSEAIIHIRDLTVEAGGQRVLSIDRLELVSGERVAIIGNSGAGKTTLLRMIKGYVQPTRGSVHVLGEPLPIRDGAKRRTYHRQIGMIHQQFDLIGRESVWQNVCHGRLGYVSLFRSIFGLFEHGDRERCRAAIEEVHLEDKLGRQARSLSGGEMQRVAIARALAQNPTILLADEPVSSLDPTLAEEILSLLVTIDTRHPLTLLMSLHHPGLANRYAERILALKDGSIIWDGPSTELSESKVNEIYGRDWTRGDRNGQPDKEGRKFPGWSGGSQGFAVAGS